mmetsp:Transcript_4439/g.8023  ORF Transcript_4439/g.8023 Transcript_4439/m.8023 type:complete len:232 (-) Transcript_4439:620-1315(-)
MSGLHPSAATNTTTTTRLHGHGTSGTGRFARSFVDAPDARWKGRLQNGRWRRVLRRVLSRRRNENCQRTGGTHGSCVGDRSSQRNVRFAICDDSLFHSTADHKLLQTSQIETKAATDTTANGGSSSIHVWNGNALSTAQRWVENGWNDTCSIPHTRPTVSTTEDRILAASIGTTRRSDTKPCVVVFQQYHVIDALFSFPLFWRFPRGANGTIVFGTESTFRSKQGHQPRES